MATILIDNNIGGSGTITVTERFSGHSVEYKLTPGQTLRVCTSPFKKISVDGVDLAHLHSPMVVQVDNRVGEAVELSK
jgi:hypothetical protein